MDPWRDLRDKIIEAVKSRVGDFVDEHEEISKLLTDRAERLASLTWELTRYTKESGQYEKTQRSMKVVAQTIENEVAALEIEAAAETTALFGSILRTVADVLMGVVPELIGFIR